MNLYIKNNNSIKKYSYEYFDEVILHFRAFENDFKCLYSSKKDTKTNLTTCISTVKGSFYCQSSTLYHVLGSQSLTLSTEFMIPGTEFIIPGTEFMIPGTEFSILSTEFIIPSTEFIISGTEFSILSTEFVMFSTGFITWETGFIRDGIW